MTGIDFTRPPPCAVALIVALCAASVAVAVAAPSAAQEVIGTLQETRATAKGANDRRDLAMPARDTLYSCSHAMMGPALDRPWQAADGTIRFADKPVIEGRVEWPHVLEITKQAESSRITGNGLPSHPTGVFPVDPNSEAAGFDRNPNPIRAQRLTMIIPTRPEIAAAPSCLPMGPIGVAVTGGVIFNALDAPGRDAVANEVFDGCEGHPQRRGLYHYHHASPCFPQGAADEHAPLIGFALDGFGIYGQRGDDGKVMTNADLDECHGHIGSVPADIREGESVYHYHLTDEFPYTLGCFRGVVDPGLLRRRAPPP